jgi:hypothetical protein
MADFWEKSIQAANQVKVGTKHFYHSSQTEQNGSTENLSNKSLFFGPATSRIKTLSTTALNVT